VDEKQLILLSIILCSRTKHIKEKKKKKEKRKRIKGKTRK
jgi:hypothetical protein